MSELEISKALLEKKNAPLLTGIMRGTEREALRVDPAGNFAQTPHPPGLGSALTHPQITTDFSESLLEFITPPSHCMDDLFDNLTAIQKFTLGQLDNELLWSTSMPCMLGDDASIPVAEYGTSNNGLMKTRYRVGLGNRYGRTMQTVAGVHYNFSLPSAFWAFLHNEENSILDLQSYRDRGYFGLIRNFRRQAWLLIYLFGASPVMCPSFVNGRKHHLEFVGTKQQSLGLPYATSLRMGDLGYQSSAQEALFVCYNRLDTYLKTLSCAISTPHADYEKIGVKDDAGEYLQLNTGLLQIENEFYSVIRPKRTTHHGETALSALRNRGVEYIEVRCLDVDPFSPLGISETQVRFLDTFLVACALQASPECDREESDVIAANQKRVVNQGRDPELLLTGRDNKPVKLRDWGLNIIDTLRPVAELLDTVHKTSLYQESVEIQRNKLLAPETTPSARVLSTMESRDQNYLEFALQNSREHHEALTSSALNEQTILRFEDMATESVCEQQALEEKNSGDFDAFLNDYYSQYKSCN
ncbi:glutamate--cysteine ligase [Teredinibacter sp. KSP-S5-2]|uniref:glutamate--cysteine ligase n=1 Tax=Teredinibacter sp. KSP-S5-2 TaxID=3034506 RepID=UPI002934A386|nr:glutamate--cysteine ligase [Teredinibacter sp. KSP-S5-2]WNO08983.1 glutamate--cysteine ligase [Teredinibacter sp. KSP-S5-2]